MMSSDVLICGAWHGGWRWNKIVPLLQQAGHKAVAPDLLGHGNDRTPVSDIRLQSDINEVCEIVNGQAVSVRDFTGVHLGDAVGYLTR